MTGDTYVRVSGELEARTPKAVKISGAWIPRSCIHGADERLIDQHEIGGNEIELRMFEWIAERSGLL